MYESTSEKGIQYNHRQAQACIKWTMSGAKLESPSPLPSAWAGQAGSPWMSTVGMPMYPEKPWKQRRIDIKKKHETRKTTDLQIETTGHHHHCHDHVITLLSFTSIDFVIDIVITFATMTMIKIIIMPGQTTTAIVTIMGILYTWYQVHIIPVSLILSSSTCRRFTLTDLLDKLWSPASSLLPPGMCLHFYRAYGTAFPLLVRFPSNVPSSRSPAFRESILIQEKVPTSMHSVRLEPTQLIVEGTRINYQATGDGMLRYHFFASVYHRNDYTQL